MGAGKKYKIDEKDPKLIAFNPANVRDETEKEIEADESFQRLKDSVCKFGVLVPLVVKPHKRGDKEFILIDGERRLRAAVATNQKTVPVHILTESESGNEMLYAFQIHMLRKEWSKTAQARSLVKIVNDIKKELGKKQEKELFDTVQEETGYNETSLKDLFRVLRYVDMNGEILDEIDNPKSNVKFSHLVQLEASFVEQIEKTFPEIIKQYGIETIRNKLLDKVRAEAISSTREPINELLPLFIHSKTAEQKQYLKKLIIDFLDNESKTPEDIFRSFELKFPINKEDLLKLVKEAEKKMEELESIMNNLQYTQFSIYKRLKDSLAKKIDSLIKVLKKAV